MNAQPYIATVDERINDAAIEETLLAMLAELQELEGHERRESLAGWVRTDWFSPCGFILEGWQGALHREAWRYHQAELDAPTPGKLWNDADHTAGRATINRLLGAEGWEHSFYATFPFRMIWTDEDAPWIAGALGCTPLRDIEMLRTWEHIDVRHVILWNPKSGKTLLLGDEAQPSHLILPEPAPDTLDVFSDTRAFFAAWTRQRATFAGMQQLHGLCESRDGHLPGALVVGSIAKVHFPPHAASSLVARKPLSRVALRDAVMRSANLPRIEEARVAHG